MESKKDQTRVAEDMGLLVDKQRKIVVYLGMLGMEFGRESFVLSTDSITCMYLGCSCWGFVRRLCLAGHGHYLSDTTVLLHSLTHSLILVRIQVSPHSTPNLHPSYS